MYCTNHKILLAIVLLPWVPACFAERADRNESIHLEADQVLMDDAKQISTFTGNVRLTQGTLLIRGDKIVVAQDKDGFYLATAYGNTAEFRQKLEGPDEYVEGYGKSIEYDTRTETVNLHEQASLKRNRDEVSGNHIIYSARTGIFKVNGSDGNSLNKPRQRVRAVLQPKTNENTESSS